MSKLLDPYRAAELDLDELVGAARSILAAAAPVAADGRVTAFPDARTVRYYQTTGLVGKPSRYDGRQAVYGFRHLLAVVAVKLLQAQGLTLAQAQRALAAATPAQLEAAVVGALDAPRSGRMPMAVPPALTPYAAALAAPGTRDLVAAEVAPGVHVTVDPACVADARAVIERIARSLDA